MDPLDFFTYLKGDEMAEPLKILPSSQAHAAGIVVTMVLFWEVYLV